MFDGHLVEEDSEDSFLHFPGVFGAQYDHLLGRKVDSHRCRRCHTSGKAIGRERTGIIDHVIRMKSLELFPRWTDEHIPHEQSMIRSGAYDADIDAVSFVPACEAIDDVDSVSGVQVVNGALAVDFPNLTGLAEIIPNDTCHVTRRGLVRDNDKGARTPPSVNAGETQPRSRTTTGLQSVHFLHLWDASSRVMPCETHLWCHRFVDWSPPHLVLRTGFLDNAFIER